MNSDLIGRIRRGTRPLEPLPTGEQRQLAVLPGVRAVLFDIYGTLLVSASGELELIAPADRGQLLAAALESLGIEPPDHCARAVQWLHETIRARHAAARVRGVTFPEVEIRDIWREVWQRWRREVPGLPEQVDIEQLALEYELRANPVWPMPHAAELLESLCAGGLRWGLVSNAQFFTPLLLETLLGRPLAELGLAVDVQFYSYEHGWAKPSPHLLELAALQLQRQGIEPAETLFVGNDLRNDIQPAAQVGFRTALFAGDRRSLRWRRDDSQLAACRPDLVVVDLRDLRACLEPFAKH